MPYVQIIVAFGPHEQSYFLGCGIRYEAVGLPTALVETIQQGKLNVPELGWMHVNQDLENWIAFNATSNTYHYSSTTRREIADHASSSRLVTFGPAPGDYLVTLKTPGAWFGNINGVDFQSYLGMLRGPVQDFDRRLNGVIFGCDGNAGFILDSGHVFIVNGEAETNPDHPLAQVVREFSTEPWNLLPISSLCPYDSRYYSLAFQKQGDTVIQRRWNLPPHMQEKLATLRQKSEEPSDQAALEQRDSLQIALAMSNAQTTMMAANALNQSSLGFLNAASTTHYWTYQ